MSEVQDVNSWLTNKLTFAFTNFLFHLEIPHNCIDIVSGEEQNPLFVLYSDAGDEQLMMSLGQLVELYYEDTRGDPEDHELITFRADVADGR